MELNTDGNSCLHCLESCEKLISIDDGINICEKCLIKAVLMVRPIEFDRLNVLESLDYLKRTADNGDNDLLRFIEWLSPFLESK